jgi:site-specific DNA-methyltransferase (adenine-specific)
VTATEQRAGRGRVELVHGDARVESSYADALARLFNLLGRAAAHPAATPLADALVTDPPYCLLTRRRRGGDERDAKAGATSRTQRVNTPGSSTVVRFEDVAAYAAFTRSWLRVAVRFLAPGAPMVVWTNQLGKQPILATAADLGWSRLEGEFTWAKRTTPRAVNQSEQLLRVYETALVLTRPRPRPVPAGMTIGIADGGREDCSAEDERSPLPWAVVTDYHDNAPVQAPRPRDPLPSLTTQAQAPHTHPHHKPFLALEPLLRAWVPRGGVVLDPFAGSGAIPAAAARLGRHAAGIELRGEWLAGANRAEGVMERGAGQRASGRPADTAEAAALSNSSGSKGLPPLPVVEPWCCF